MPELPEVEVTKRGLVVPLEGATILRASLGKPLRWPLGIDPQELHGRVVQRVLRRGKYIVLQLDHGVLLIHLGMSGSLQMAPKLPPAGTHDHFDLVCSRCVLRLHDPRRFGAVVWAPDLQSGMAAKLLGQLGTEPLEEGFTFAYFFQGLQRSRTPIKQLLLGGAPGGGRGQYLRQRGTVSGTHRS